MSRITTTIGLLTLLALPLRVGAALADADLLLVNGDFEKSTYTQWFSNYSNAAKRITANTLYADPSASMGTNTTTSNDAVADGWLRSTDLSINPQTDISYRIVPGGINGSNCQYFEVLGTKSGQAQASLDTHLPVSTNKSWQIHPGDTITFRVDSLRMSGYSSLPAGASVAYSLRLGTASEKALTPSDTSFADEISLTIPPNTTDINVRVAITVKGNIGTSHPGIYVDGAHIYVKRLGKTDYDKWQIPVERNRTTSTHNIFFHPTWTDTYAAARDYDSLALHEGDYAVAPVLRRMNPSIKLYLYQSCTFGYDRRDSTGKDMIMNSTPVTYFDAKTNHLEFLYGSGAGKDGYASDTPNSNRYFLRLANPNYQTIWADRVIQMAKRIGVDGVWIDDMGTLEKKTDSAGKLISPQRDLWECQQFIHAVYSKLQAAGLEVVQNSNVHISGPGDQSKDKSTVMFLPSWTPTSAFPASAGYSANSPGNVANVFFQEYAFLISRPTENACLPDLWLRCLTDMDEIARWNAATNPQTGSPLLGATEKRRMHMWVTGTEFAKDTPYGVDGWVHFGFCSYMLAQNPWTSFGAKVSEPEGDNANPQPYPDMNLGITKLLGDPAGGHAAINGDQYFRSRTYNPNASGGVGGVVIVNANASQTRQYTLGFDAMDEQGTSLDKGSVITLKPRTGRILLRKYSSVEVSVVVNSSNIAPGQETVVRVNYANRTGSDASNVVIRAQVPAEMTYVSGSAEITGGVFDAASSSVSWVEPLLTSGSSGTKTFKAMAK